MPLFDAHPQALAYADPSVAAQLVAAVAMIAAAQVLRRVRFSAGRRGVTRTWPPSLLVFGVAGAVLAVARAEAIAWLAMPLWSALWAGLAALLAVLQAAVWRRRTYTVVPVAKQTDPRDAYLPGKRRS